MVCFMLLVMRMQTDLWFADEDDEVLAGEHAD